MKIHRNSLLCTLLLLTIVPSQAFPVAFEERRPRDERAILVPKGARPMVKEEYPRGQLVVDRIKARHSHVLIIPFSRSWNTAAVTATTGIEMEEEPGIERNDFELGFALHSQRLRVGSLRNREYFQKETEGFPEGWYRPLQSADYIDRPKGYTNTTFMHLAAKRVRRKYTDYRDFSDRIYGVLNVVMKQNKQLNFTAQRDMHNFRMEGMDIQPGVRNTASISFRMPGEGANKLEFHGNSTWSTLTDSSQPTQRDFRYLSGTGSVAWCRGLRPDFNVDLKAKVQVSTLRDRTYSSNTKTLETRKSGWLEMSNVVSPAEFFKVKLIASGLYDSEYEGYSTSGIELALTPRVVQASVGFRKRAILPDYDELYWPSKFVRVNDSLKPVDFWEAYGSFSINLITRLTFSAKASYSRPEYRITWNQPAEYVWEPVREETSEALTSEASVLLRLIGDLGTFASLRYQHFDSQLFDPEIIADAGFSYGRSVSGSITLGASFWNFQPFDTSQPPEDMILAYLRISKRFFRALNVFVDGRYTFDHEDVLYYRGMPQAGRIVSIGANIVFGGLD